MTLRILTCSDTSFIVEATKYLLRMSLKSLQSMRMTLDSKWTLTSHTFRLVAASQILMQ